MTQHIHEGAARYQPDHNGNNPPMPSATQALASPQQLVTEHIDLWTSAIRRKSTAGRGSGNSKNRKIELAGIKKLRELILELAVHGKLVAQNLDDEPASKLLECIEVEKDRLSKEEGLKTKASDNLGRDEEYIEVPSHWSWARLGNLAKFIDYRGKTPKKIESGIRLITAKNIRRGYIDLNPEEFIAESDYDSWMTRGLPRNGDMLFTTEAPMGNAASINLSEKFALAQRAICFQWHSSEISEFMLLQVLSGPFQRQLSDQATGMTATGIKASKLKEIPVTLPPLAEQKRIVAKVDELMALCDQLEQQSEHQLDAHQQLTETLLSVLLTPAAGAFSQPAAGAPTDSADATTKSSQKEQLNDNWQRLANHFDLLFSGPMGAWAIDRLKDTILQLAVMGKLVPQNPADEPASELLKRIDAEKARLVKEGKIKKPKKLPPVSDDEKPFELPQGWEYERLANLTDIQSGIAKGKKFDRQDTVTFPYLRVANVQRGFLILDEMKEIEILKSDVEKYAVIERDLLITEGGDWDKVGRTAIWPRYDGIMLHQNHVFKARLILADQSEIWMERFLNSRFAREYFAGSSKQTTNLASINKTQLSNTVIPVPPLAEQQRIVAKVDELFALCDQLKDHLQQASDTQLNITDAIVYQALN